MKFIKLTVLCLFCPSISFSAGAGLTVLSYKAAASTNAFAPLDRSAYFDEDSSENSSLAIVNATGDWTGTNFGGSTDTWHWTSAVNTNVATQFDQSSLRASGTGTFTWNIATTTNFVNPSNQTVLYAPGSATDYGGVFVLDSPGEFTLQAVLSRYAAVGIYSRSLSESVYRKVNNSNTPFVVTTGGPLPAGEYAFSIGANSYGVGSAGASNITHSGSFTNFNFTVSVPEPSLLGAAGLAGLFLRRRRWSV